MERRRGEERETKSIRQRWLYNTFENYGPGLYCSSGVDIESTVVIAPKKQNFFFLLLTIFTDSWRVLMCLCEVPSQPAGVCVAVGVGGMIVLLHRFDFRLYDYL